MPYIGLKPGERVSITIDGYLSEVWSDGVKVSFRDDHGNDHTVEIPTEATAVSIVVGDLPDAWPPQPGDIWHLTTTRPDGGPCTGWEAWHAHAARNYVHGRSAVAVQMVNPHVPGYARRSPEELLDLGELRLVWRDDSPVVHP